MRTKVSKKQVADFYKDSQSECNWSVISFDPVTRRRDLASGSYSMIQALEAFANEGAKGHLVILTDKEGWDSMRDIEIKQHSRVTFEQMKPYKKVFSSISLEVRSGSFL